MQPLLGLDTQELSELATSLNNAAYRGKQLARNLYVGAAESIAEMRDLPLAFRAQLAANYEVGRVEACLKSRSPDDAVKYLMNLSDGQKVESVYLPYKNRVSACLSSQVGCAAGCTFCATAKGGLARNLTAGEIVGQLLRMQKDADRRISHVVYMGMGEPMWNYEALVKSVRLLGGEMGLSLRNVTISTVGVPPGIRALAKENLPVTLALSLHAPDDSLRATLIPTARKWKLDEILEACEEYATTTRRNLTFEYLMIGDVNDRPEQARALAALLAKWRLPGNVNLIPFNHVETPEGYRRPDNSRLAQFREELERAGRTVTQRMTRGAAVSAACGQLRREAISKSEIAGQVIELATT